MRSFHLLPFVATPEPVVALSAAKRELTVAWERYKQNTIRYYRDGLEFGRICFEWRAKYKAQGSHNGKGFDHILEQVDIPKTTAYRWIRRYETKNALRAKRNEAEGNPLKPDGDPPSHTRGRATRISFCFFLAEEEHHQFEEDVKTLGGHKRVTEMFLDFVSRNAFEKRSVSTVREKTACCYEDIRPTA